MVWLLGCQVIGLLGGCFFRVVGLLGFGVVGDLLGHQKGSNLIAFVSKMVQDFSLKNRLNHLIQTIANTALLTIKLRSKIPIVFHNVCH